MTEIYNVYEAKTQFSALIDRAHEGEQIVIAKGGKPWAIIAPVKAQKPKRVPGLLKGKMWIADDAFSPEVDAAIAADFEASEILPPDEE